MRHLSGLLILTGVEQLWLTPNWYAPAVEQVWPAPDEEGHAPTESKPAQ